MSIVYTVNRGIQLSKEYRYRLAIENDVPTIVELNYELFREDGGQRDASMNVEWPRQSGAAYFPSFVRDKERYAAVAEVGDRVVGYLVGYVIPKSTLYTTVRAELESMYVRREDRGKGVGAQLAEDFVEWARSKGAEEILVTAYSANEDAIRFYRQQGFVDKKQTLGLPIR